MKPDQRPYLLPKPPWVIYLDKLATGNKKQCHLYPPSPWPPLHTHIFHSPFPNLFCLFSPYTTRSNKTKSRTVYSNHVIKWISITVQAPVSSDHKLTSGEIGLICDIERKRAVHAWTTLESCIISPKLYDQIKKRALSWELSSNCADMSLLCQYNRF